jgi:hypothetical protein
VRLYHRQPLPEQFTFVQFATAPPATTSNDGWQITTIDLRVDDTARMLILEMLFGLAIFI